MRFHLSGALSLFSGGCFTVFLALQSAGAVFLSTLFLISDATLGVQRFDFTALKSPSRDVKKVKGQTSLRLRDGAEESAEDGANVSTRGRLVALTSFSKGWRIQTETRRTLVEETDVER